MQQHCTELADEDQVFRRDGFLGKIDALLVFGTQAPLRINHIQILRPNARVLPLELLRLSPVMTPCKHFLFYIQCEWILS